MILVIDHLIILAVFNFQDLIRSTLSQEEVLGEELEELQTQKFTLIILAYL